MIKKTLIASLLISTLGVAYSIEVSNTHVSSYLEEPLRLEADLKGAGEIKLAAPTEYLKFNHPVLNYDVSLQVVGEGENRRLVLSSTESIDDPSVVILLEAKDANNNVQVFELPVLLDFKTGAPSVIKIDGDTPKTEAPKADTKVADAKPKKADEKKPVDNKVKINEPTKVVATEKTKADELAKDKAAAQARLDASSKIEADAKLEAKAQAEEKAKVAAQAKLEAKTQAEEKAKVAAQAKLEAKTQAEEKAKAAAQAKLNAKTQAEEKAKVAAQAKLNAKTQVEEKAKAAAQAKLEAKAQAEEKAKTVAQTKLDAKAQAEEKAKTAAQTKLDERGALDARVKAEAQARFEANTKTQTLQTEVGNAPVALPSPSASHYGPVKDGETLWSIANKVKPSSVSTQNMLKALREQNPRAFSQGVLLKGATLVVPDLLNSNATPAQNESSIIKTERIESPEMVNNKIEEIVIGIIYELPPIPETKTPPAVVEPPPVVVEPPPVVVELPPAVVEPPPVVVEPPPVVVEPPPAVVEPPPAVVEPPVAVEPPPVAIEPPPAIIEEPPVVKTPPVTPTPQIEDRGIVGLLIDNIVYIGMAFFAVIMGLLGIVFIRHNREEKRIDDELNQLNREFSTEEELFIEELSSDDISSIIDEPIEEFDFDALDEIIAEDEPAAFDDLPEEAHEISEQDVFLSENLEALKTAPKKDYTEDAGENLAFDLETLTTDLTPSGAKIEKITPQDEDVSAFIESMTDLEGSLTDDRQEFAFDSIEKISEMKPSEVTAPSSEEITDISEESDSFTDKSEDYESVQVKLDLAEAYMKIDKSLASPLLEEVIRDGNSEQIKQAERLKAEEPSADIYEPMDSQEAFEIPEAIDAPEEIALPESIDLPEEIDFPDADELFEETNLIEEVIDTPEEIVTSDDLPEIMEVIEEQEIEPASEEEVHEDYESERIKLELAEAYLNFDVTLAKPLLAEVLRDGNPEQIAKAQAILDKL